LPLKNRNCDDFMPMEKPVAESVEQAQRLSERAEQLGIPLLVGHQRRHNPFLKRSRELIANGVLGRLVSATARAVPVQFR
jgi:predicted dehydrogenase